MTCHEGASGCESHLLRSGQTKADGAQVRLGDKCDL